MKTNGDWANVTVAAWSWDQSKILLKYEDGQEKWVDAEKIKDFIHIIKKDDVVGKRVVACITLPSMTSRHAGMEYKGFCLER